MSANTDNKTGILVSLYGADAPDAAKFGVGATTLADIERATEARRELSDQQSTTTSGRCAASNDAMKRSMTER